MSLSILLRDVLNSTLSIYFVTEMSDDDDIRDDPEFSSNDDASDVDPGQCDDDRPRHSRMKSHSIGNTFTARVCLLFVLLKNLNGKKRGQSCV